MPLQTQNLRAQNQVRKGRSYVILKQVQGDTQLSLLLALTTDSLRHPSLRWDDGSSSGDGGDAITASTLYDLISPSNSRAASQRTQPCLLSDLLYQIGHGTGGVQKRRLAAMSFQMLR